MNTNAFNIIVITAFYIMALIFGWSAGMAAETAITIFVITKVIVNFKRLHVRENYLPYINNKIRFVIWNTIAVLVIVAIITILSIIALVVGTTLSYVLTGETNDVISHWFSLIGIIYLSLNSKKVFKKKETIA